MSTVSNNPDSNHPESMDHGELHPIVQGLDVMLAARISRDLRALKIPAAMRRQGTLEIDPASGAESPVDTGLFEVLVPEEFEGISHEVLDVTHLKREGTATTEEILAALHADDEILPESVWDDAIPEESLWKKLTSFALLSVLVITAIWTVILSML